MKDKDIIEKAVSYFRNGYNCTESILLTVAELYKIDSYIPRIASAFGGVLEEVALCVVLLPEL